MSDEASERSSPPAVVTAVALGSAALPFLAIYAVIFLIHGSVHPVDPPDVTGSTHGEFVAGLVALVLLIGLAVALLWLLNGRRRWPFAVLELVVVGGCGYFLLDTTAGGRAVSIVVGLAALIAVVLAFAPSTWVHVGSTPPRRLRAAPRRGRGRSGVSAPMLPTASAHRVPSGFTEDEPGVD